MTVFRAVSEFRVKKNCEFQPRTVSVRQNKQGPKNTFFWQKKKKKF